MCVTLCIHRNLVWTHIHIYIQCGSNAFARVSKSWVPADQSIPASVKARLVRRNSSPPVVKALALDTNFNAVDWSKYNVPHFLSYPPLNIQIRTGKVNIAIQAANFPGAETDIQIPGSRRTSRASRRGLFGGFKSIFSEATSAVVGEVTGAYIVSSTSIRLSYCSQLLHRRLRLPLDP
jgi:hypothetical protein